MINSKNAVYLDGNYIKVDISNNKLQAYLEILCKPSFKIIDKETIKENYLFMWPDKVSSIFANDTVILHFGLQGLLGLSIDLNNKISEKQKENINIVLDNNTKINLYSLITYQLIEGCNRDTVINLEKYHEALKNFYMIIEFENIVRVMSSSKQMINWCTLTEG